MNARFRKSGIPAFKEPDHFPAAKICAAYGAPSLEQFTADAFDRAMKKLSATIAANAEQNQPALGDVLAEALGNE